MVGYSDSVAAGPAVGQFEIKSLEAVPGRVELQSQNAFSFGNPRRATVEHDGGIEADDNSIARTRAALEVEYTFTSFFKARIGVEYEDERLDEVASLADANRFGAVKLDEYEIEGIVVLVPRPEQGAALGFLVEYEHPAEAGGAQTINFGPIVEWVSGPWLTTFNPSLVSFHGGERNEQGRYDDKVDFRYAGRVMYRASDGTALALEAYGTVERIAGTGNPGQQALLFGDFDQHRLGPVVYLSYDVGEQHAIRSGRETEVTLGLGAFAGLNRDTPDATLKLSLEVEF